MIMLSFVSATRVILITIVIIIQMNDGKSNFPKTLLSKIQLFEFLKLTENGKHRTVLEKLEQEGKF